MDVLSHPELGRTDAGIDHVMAEQAADNRVAIAITLRRLLTVAGKDRSHILSHMRRNIRLAQEFDAPVIATSGATAAIRMRAPRELAAFPRVLGMDIGPGFDTVSTVPRRILERADRVMSDEFVRPGVEMVEGDPDG
ncbi:MAG: RNase P subunit p30 family protein [Candidatus Nanohaloarchaea archaeon]